MSTLLIKGPKIYVEEGVLHDQAVLISQGKISRFVDVYSKETFEDIIEFPSTYSLVPGRIDLHIHGLAGVDVMDATPESLINMAKKLPEEGTTSFLATTMSLPVDAIVSAIKNVVYVMQNPALASSGAMILGLHLEGPFIAPSRMGAHEKEYLIKPDIQLIQEWQKLAKNSIKLLTFAPELENACALIQGLRELNIIPAIGHSNATYAQACTAIQAGCKHVTHLFNAMSGLNHRNPGVVLAALQTQIMCELIADGHHVAWEMLKFVMHLKGKHELCLVTDSMRAKCMPEGKYTLGHQTVHVHEGAARLEDGTLAGSVLTMQKAVKNLIEHDICTLEETIYLTSINPAKQLGLFDEVGSIGLEKWADLVVLNENNCVVMTMVRGKILYSCEKYLTQNI